MKYRVVLADWKNPKDTFVEEVEADNAVSAIHVAERNHPGCIGIEANIQQ